MFDDDDDDLTDTERRERLIRKPVKLGKVGKDGLDVDSKSWVPPSWFSITDRTIDLEGNPSCVQLLLVAPTNLKEVDQARLALKKIDMIINKSREEYDVFFKLNLIIQLINNLGLGED